MEIVGIHPNYFGPLNGHPNKIPKTSQQYPNRRCSTKLPQLFTAFQTQHISASLPYFVDQSQRFVYVSYVRLLSKTSSDANLRNLRPLTPAPPLGLGGWKCARARGNVVPTSPQPTIGNSGAAPGAQQPTKETVDWLGFSPLCGLNLHLHSYVHIYVSKAQFHFLGTKTSLPLNNLGTLQHQRRC